MDMYRWNLLWQTEGEHGAVCVRASERMLFFGIADGSGGGSRAAGGGRVSLAAVGDCLSALGVVQAAQYPFPDELPCLLMRAVRSALTEVADAEGADFAEYGSSLLAAAIDPKTGIYLLCGLGGGSAFGFLRDGTPLRLYADAPMFGMRSMPLTTADNAISHLQLSFGTAERYSRILLLSDRGGRLCRGSRLSREGSDLLFAGSARQLAAELAHIPDAVGVLVGC